MTGGRKPSKSANLVNQPFGIQSRPTTAPAPTTAASKPCQLKVVAGLAPDDRVGLAEVVELLAEPELLAVALGELDETGGGYVDP